MNISILGTGNMATGLAVIFAKAGHTVTLGSRDAEKAKAVANTVGTGIAGHGVSGYRVGVCHGGHNDISHDCPP